MWSKSKHISCMASKINEIVNNDNVIILNKIWQPWIKNILIKNIKIYFHAQYILLMPNSSQNYLWNTPFLIHALHFHQNREHINTIGSLGFWVLPKWCFLESPLNTHIVTHNIRQKCTLTAPKRYLTPK